MLSINNRKYNFMTTNKVWKAYKLDISRGTDFFDLIKNQLINYIDSHNLRFWVTRYFEQGDIHPHLQFRVYVNSDEQKEIEEYLDRMENRKVILKKHSAINWQPIEDATNRLNSVSNKLEPLREKAIQGYGNFQFPVSSYLDSLNPVEERVEELAALFGAVGEATKAFYKALPRKPIDPLIMSITLHILINSLTYSCPGPGTEEETIRLLPPLG